MACFLATVAEAVVVSVIQKQVEHREAAVSKGNEDASRESRRIPMSRKLSWLSKMLWGGSALLAIEHVWHGEVVPWFPFLTGLSDPSALWQEILTVGGTMMIIVTLAWAALCVIVERAAQREIAAKEEV